MDQESIFTSRSLNEELEPEDIPSCPLCDRLYPQMTVKCCSKFLCFTCYNKMVLSGRTLSCPYCRSNPLLFENDTESEAESEAQNGYNSEAESESQNNNILLLRPRMVNLSIDFSTIEDFINFMSNINRNRNYSDQILNSLSRSIRTSPLHNSNSLFRTNILCTRTLFLLFLLTICYFVPNILIFAFYLGYMFGTFNRDVLTILLFYPIIYPCYIYKEYIKDSTFYRYISSLSIIDS